MFEVIGCLLITVFIHELAHMLVALKCGIGVKAFSIGFGKPRLHKTIKGIDFRLSPILLGGYCDLKGMDGKKDKDDFLRHPYRNKFGVLVAGAFANILLAFVCYLIHYGSIIVGLQVDWIFLKAIFGGSIDNTLFLFEHYPTNSFLLQLSVLNIFCGITNLIPIPPLDGGHLWLVHMEKIWKKKFIKLYSIVNKISFWVITALQLWLVYWLYSIEINQWLNSTYLLIKGLI